MENNISIESLTKKERKELRHQEKKQSEEAAFQRKKNKRIAKWVLGLIIVVGSMAALFWYVATRPHIPEGEIISQSGLHWHPELALYVKGIKQEIPANIGIGAVHQPIHTHDSTGVLHLEMQGVVHRDDIKLARFFEVWGKDVMEFGSSVSMTVNGEVNAELGNYQMKDGDKVELRYD